MLRRSQFYFYSLSSLTCVGKSYESTDEISEKRFKYHSLKKEREKREREGRMKGRRGQPGGNQERSFKLLDFVPAPEIHSAPSARWHALVRVGTRRTTKCRACAWLHGETWRPSRGKRKDSGESFRRDKLA